MKREEAYRLAMRACEETWNEKTCKQIREAFEQEPCEDWYDVPSDEMTLEQARQAVKDLRKKLVEHLEQESCVVNIKDLSDDEIKKFEEVMKKVTVQVISKEPCENAISRQAAIEKIHWLGLDHDTAIKCDLALRALPSVNPQEPKTGHWQDLTGLFFCSECDGGFAKPWRYCPNCGAKMEEQA